MPFIQIKTGPNKGKVFEIREQVLTVGRDENQTIQILDQGVSRAHAEIFRMGEMAFVRDLNSTNGTFINNVKATEEALKSGDELLIGTTILSYSDGNPTDEARAENETQQAMTKEGVKIEPAAAKRPKTATGRSITSRNLTLFREVGELLNPAKDLDAGIRAAVQRVAEGMEADHAYFFMQDSPGARPALRVAMEQGQGGAEKKVSRTILSRVLSSGEFILAVDASLDGRFSLSESVVLKKVKSVVAVPVVVSGRTAGVLYFHISKPDKPFKAEDLELAAATALQLGSALGAGPGPRNREIVRRYYEELWNKWNLALAPDLLAPDFSLRGWVGSQVGGIEAFKQYVSSVRAAFPDFHNTIDELVAEGDRVVARLTYKGTHKGKFFGVEATGKSVKYPGTAVFRIAQGRLADGWVVADNYELLKQLDPDLGGVPSPKS